MLGGESASCPMTCVFFRMVSLVSRQALLKRVMSYWRPSAEWAVTAASSAKRKSRRHFSWTLGFVWRGRGALIRSGSEVEALCSRTEGVFQHESKGDPKQGRCENAALFHSAVDVEGVWSWAVKDHCTLHVIVKRSDEAEQPGWTSDLGEDFKEAIPADKVESLRKVYEG